MKKIQLHFGFFLCLLIGQEVAVAQVQVSARGTGRTTGHILTLAVTNRGEEAVKVLPQTLFIPSDGTHQGYVGRIPGGANVPPGGNAQVPVNGYCTDGGKPPVPPSGELDNLESWTPVGAPARPKLPGEVALIDQPPVRHFSPGDIAGITASPAYSPFRKEPVDSLRPTWPGTDLLVGGTANVDKFPQTFAPVIVQLLQELERAVGVVQQNPALATPFSTDPLREREAVIQQVIWIYMGALTGSPYTKPVFSKKIKEQYQRVAGGLASSEEQKEEQNLGQGVEDFWAAFVATGVEAKVLKAAN